MFVKNKDKILEEKHFTTMSKIYTKFLKEIRIVAACFVYDIFKMQVQKTRTFSKLQMNLSSLKCKKN